ncbi:MAG: hypothetical protein RLZZ292_3980 [Bacteroidota bacterium]|jgi:hypothetical protein
MDKNIFFILALLFLYSCKKEIDCNPTPYWQTGAVIKNGEAMSFNAAKGIIHSWPGLILLELSRKDIETVHGSRETITISKVPTKVGIYPIKDTDFLKDDRIVNAGYTTGQGDGDILSGNYLLYPKDSAYVAIDYIDTLSRLVQGLFSVTFLEYHDKTKEIVDTFRFTRGNFFVRYN